MKYSLGLDIGTTSIGWAIVDEGEGELHEEKRKRSIVRMGVRLFTIPENPKDGSSLAETRREARGARRRLRRRRGRLDAIQHIFIQHGLLTKDQIQKILSTPHDSFDVRVQLLDKRGTAEELFIALYHIAKRRGYKSNRKEVEKNEKETQGLLGNISANSEKLKKWRTVAEMLIKEYPDRQRNRGFRSGDAEGDKKNIVAAQYIHLVSRKDLESEVETLISRQEKFGAAYDSSFRSAIHKAIFYQKPFASGDSIKEKIGTCEFFPSEQRTAKASYSFELFRIWSELAHIRIKDKDGAQRPLTLDEKKRVVEKAHNNSTITYKTIRTTLKIPKEEVFAGLVYFVVNMTTREREEKEPEGAGGTKFSLQSYQKIKKAIQGADESFWDNHERDRELLDAMANVLTLYKTDEDVAPQLEALHLPEKVQVALMAVSFDKVCHLSRKALDKLIPAFENGAADYRAACDAAGLSSKKLGVRAQYLPGLDKHDNTLTNPVMKRAVSQVIKVVNAIVREYGSPYMIKIECARDLARDHSERRKIQLAQEENAKRNEELKNQIIELGVVAEPKGLDITKFKLYKEQQGICAYSLKPMEEGRLFEDGYTEIDHIVPYSRSGDDRNVNKVLVLRQANQEKLNRTPYEWFGADEERWTQFEGYVRGCKSMPFNKQHRLLLKKAPTDPWASRALNDTRYISRYIKEYIEDKLQFAEGDKKKRVVTSTGAATAYLRRRWKIEKEREASDVHHAADAAVIAVMSESMIQRINTYSKAKDISRYLQAEKIHADSVKTMKDNETGDMYDATTLRLAEEIRNDHEKRVSFPQPWDGFDAEVRDKVKNVFVSRMPKRSVRGEAHAARLHSIDLAARNLTRVREGKKIKNNDSGVLINKGKSFAENGKIARVDIFEKVTVKGKRVYGVVPIYVHQTVLRELPKEIQFGRKKQLLSSDCKFLFSLFHSDLVRVEDKKGIKRFGYYIGFDVSDGRLTLDTVDGSASEEKVPEKSDENKKEKTNFRVMSETLGNFEKHIVGVLGEIHKVHSEIRMPFTKKRKK